MTIKIVYIEPGTMLDVRFCDPVFDMPPGKAAWDMSAHPRSMLIEIPDSRAIVVPFDVSTFVNIGTHRKQRL
jgi:hypothetical protein